MCVYIYICMYVCVYIYIYIYMKHNARFNVVPLDALGCTLGN